MERDGEYLGTWEALLWHMGGQEDKLGAFVGTVVGRGPLFLSEFHLGAWGRGGRSVQPVGLQRCWARVSSAGRHGARPTVHSTAPSPTGLRAGVPGQTQERAGFIRVLQDHREASYVKPRGFCNLPSAYFPGSSASC